MESTTEPRPFPKWIYVALTVTAALCVFSIYKRFRVESRNKATTIVAEYETIESLAAAQGITADEGVHRLHARGLGGVVLTEETVADLLTAGKVAVRSGALSTTDSNVRARLERAIDIRFGQVNVRTLPGGAYAIEAVPRASLGLERTMSVGLNPTQCLNAKNEGMTIVGRFANPPGITPQAIRGTLSWAKEMGCSVFMPLGDQVLGRRDTIKDTVASLRELGMLYASPEFAKIGGDENVVQLAPDIVVRLHPAQEAELDKLPYKEAVDRYARASRERNMRMLLLRPVSYGSDNPVATFGDFVDDIRKEIKSQGGAIGRAKPFQEPGVPKWLYVLIGLSLAPSFYFLASSVWSGKKWTTCTSAAVVLAGLACYSDGLRPMLALFGAMLFPLVAFLLLDLRRGKSVALEVAMVTAVSVIGGMVVAGLLNGVPYYVVAKAFPGVKLSVFGPIALIGVYYFSRLGDPSKQMAGAITWRGLALSLAFIAALALMWMRTGNDNPAAVSEWELKVRDLLDAALFVRPRTKAFLIGFPLLTIGVAMLIRYRSGLAKNPNFGAWTAMALMAGAIGATDIVNTLCHLHTQIELSALRILVGATVGCILGAVVWGLLGRARSAAEG